MTGLLPSNWHPLGAGEDGLGSLEVCDRYERRVGLVLRPDPGAGFVPAHLGFVAQGDVIHVDQHFVAALAVPHLTAGISRVEEDRSDS
jgi:hypothetical protein